MGVVQHLKGLGDNADLSLKTLSGKLILLMALTLASRTLELQALDLCFRYFRPEDILFKLVSLTKKHKVGSSPKSASLEHLLKVIAYVWSNVFVSMKRSLNPFAG